MIPVKPAPEPQDFDIAVRRPGAAFLARCPSPSGNQWKPLWRKALPGAVSAYGDVCAYYCFSIGTGTSGVAEIDHFLPKSKRPDLAYEWKNFRLASKWANTAKGDRSVLDPFSLRPDSFRIFFVTGEVVPSPDLSDEHASKCRETIDVLKLNRQELRKRRISDFDDFIHGKIAIDHLQRESPFVAVEVKRLGIRAGIGKNPSSRR